MVAGAAVGARISGCAAGRAEGADRLRRGRDAIAIGRRATGGGGAVGARQLRAGCGRRGDHRGQPGVGVAGLFRSCARCRLHEGVAWYAVSVATGAGRSRPDPHTEPVGGGGPRGACRRIRTRQPRSHLWHPRGVRRRLTAFGRDRDRHRRRSRVRLCPSRRGRHRVGAPRPQRRISRSGRRRAGASLRAGGRAAVGGRLRLVRGVQLESGGWAVPTQSGVLGRRTVVGRRPGRAQLYRYDALVECQAPQRLCADPRWRERYQSPVSSSWMPSNATPRTSC